MEIRPSTSLRNQYSEISDYCKNTGEPIYLTKNGEGDLVVMSIEAFEERERIFRIKEKIIEDRLLAGVKPNGYSLEELDAAIKSIVQLNK